MEAYGGVSAFPAAAWDRAMINRYLSIFKGVDHPATVVVWKTFGDCVPFVERFCKQMADRQHAVEVHISAETARRTGRRGHQIAPRLTRREYNAALERNAPVILRAVRRRVSVVVNQLQPVVNDNTEVFLSLGLEDNLSHAAARNGIAIMKEMMPPGWHAVRSPMTRSDIIKAAFNEEHTHHFSGWGSIWNFDGTNIRTDGDKFTPHILAGDALRQIQRHRGGYRLLFLWSSAMQGRRNGRIDQIVQYHGRKYDISLATMRAFRKILLEVQK